MKNSILLAIICVLIQSCNSQEKDLAKITFTEKYDIFFGDIPHKFNLTVYAKTYTGYYESESEEILNFDEVNLSDTNEEGGFGTNSVRFAFTTKDHILCEYIVDLNTKKSIQKMIDALNSKFGKAKFVSKLDLTDDLPDSYIWQDKQIIYLLMGTTQNSAWLTVFDINYKELYDNRISGPFMYYYDYLEYLLKNKKTEKQISYYQYAKIMEKEGTDYYIDNYVKP
ncbi:hypothetical protein FNW52_10285 [Flavobacterium sp. ZT3R18]|uniref:hypothetical protein n=1 Tax=Flavobacterium sp. ZT3R18 TaxID=2594429 RepID=UPI00117A70A0|nr:hypothetical protein [Flavobacterium sp. ZT3R18]TRX35867.1 hypothetical protein FNW52_10285 [Flavobacterium sp. ZT3R18]